MIFNQMFKNKFALTVKYINLELKIPNDYNYY